MQHLHRSDKIPEPPMFGDSKTKLARAYHHASAQGLEMQIDIRQLKAIWFTLQVG